MAAFMEDFNNSTKTNPKTLGDWVKNFRIKKIQMKRKLRNGGDLRVCAILTTALISAEEELRRKQQERFHRWTEIQSKYGYFRNNADDDNKFYCSNNDNYNNSKNNSHINYKSNSSCASEIRNYYNNKLCQESDIDSQQEFKDSLWKYELSGLDEFMKNMSRNSCSVKN